MTPFRKKQATSGFTFIEVLFSLVIFSVGLLAVTTMGTYVIKSNYQSKNLTNAVNLALNKLDHLKSDPNITDPEYKLDGMGVSGKGIFDRKVLVVARKKPDYKTVEIIVSWSDSTNRNVIIKTIIAD